LVCEREGEKGEGKEEVGDRERSGEERDREKERERENK